MEGLRAGEEGVFVWLICEKEMGMFAVCEEKDISLAILEAFYSFLKDVVVSDVVIVGGGPSGLIAGYYLAKGGRKVVIVERNNAPGGGAWSGGFLMNQLTVRAPAHQILEELGVQVREVKQGIFVGDAQYICASLIRSAISAGVKILNLTYCEDIVLKNGKVCGVVINWSPIQFMPRHLRMLDPIVIESKAVVDSTGHDASVVAMLKRRGLAEIVGEGAMHLTTSEEQVVKKTGKVFPGLYICGMSVSAVYGLPRMGPTFGAMYLSGKRVAEIILEDQKWE